MHEGIQSHFFYHGSLPVMQEYFYFPRGMRPMTHLKTLHHARHHLMLQATVLSLCILTDGDEVDIVIPASTLFCLDIATLTC